MAKPPIVESRLLIAPVLAVIAAMACFQVGAAFAKGLFPAVGPLGAATIRMVLGAVILLAMARPWRTWPQGAPIMPLLGLGVSTAATIGMFYQAINHLPLGVAIAIQFLGPLSIALFGSRRPTDLIWAVLAAAGVWLLVGVGGVDKPLHPVGIAWSLGAGAGWAGYILFGRAASGVFGASTAALAFSVAAILILPMGVYQVGAALLSPALIPLALLVALFSTVIPGRLELYAMGHMPARTFAVFMSLEPAFAILSGLVILGERLAPAQVLGIGVVMTAAAGATWASGRAAQPA
jgi:inner membrane transporter RhtA